MVSVIIPTIRRPELVRRAIESVTRQTCASLEIIVIVDGPDEATWNALQAIADPRLRVLRNDAPMGPGPARNRAAQAAHGDWVAFLDDDDEWLPEKLARQLDGRSPEDDVVLSCRCRIETARAVYVWPQRLYSSDEPVDEYLFARRSLRRSDAYLATPTIVLPRRLFLATGFGATEQNEDTTLLLRLTKTMGAELVMLPDILTVIHTEEARWSIGSVFDWRESLDWIDAMGSLITRAAYSGFLLVTLGSQAADQGDPLAIPTLLGRAFRRGRPTLRQLLLFAAFWAVPQRVRQRVRETASRLGGLRRAATSSHQPC
ncbi:MAG: glycosyltransferase family 2 protein [Proteobacteria bacterium]|nr:glycosyltransferase family 2 protein [Pseudomonadota bacterium]